MKNINFEKVVLFLIALSFFVGIWHAFPMLNVVNDEMYFVGGVLRAIENHTIIPQAGDVPYGTLTYILNYGMTLATLAVLLPFYKFSILDLKLFLIQSPSVMYFSLRLLSSLLSLVMLFFVNKLLKKEVEDVKTRAFLLVLLFTNIIVSVIMHTGKMWVLSTLLVVISFYYLYKALESNTEPESIKNRSMFLSIFFSFLAVSNFPLNAFSLISIPILLFYYKSNRDTVRKILLYTFIGCATYVCITLFNFESIKSQVISIFSEYHPIVGENAVKLNFIKSFYIYFIKIIILFPLLILTLGFSLHNRIKNYKLFIISNLYFISYLLCIVLVANWTSDMSSALRYLFPLGFFLLFIISSFNLKFTKVFYLLGLVSIVFYIFTLYYLSVPTTYNKANSWVIENLASEQVVIINDVSELQLTKNKESSTYTKEEFCASKCKNIISSDLNSDFKPLVLDLLSKEYNLKNVNITYYIKEIPTSDASITLVTSFYNTSDIYHSVDYNLGSYFDLSFYKIKNLGKNIYIYELNK